MLPLFFFLFFFNQGDQAQETSGHLANFSFVVFYCNLWGSITMRCDALFQLFIICLCCLHLKRCYVVVVFRSACLSALFCFSCDPSWVISCK